HLPPPPRSSLFPYTTLFRSRSRLVVSTAVFLRRRWLSGLVRGSASCARSGLWERSPGCTSGWERIVVVVGDGWPALGTRVFCGRSEEHTSELQSLRHLVCRL